MTLSEMFEQQMEYVDFIAYSEVGYINKNSLSSDEAVLLGKLHAKYFYHKYGKPCGCNPKQTKIWINDLEKLALNGYK